MVSRIESIGINESLVTGRQVENLSMECSKYIVNLSNSFTRISLE